MEETTPLIQLPIRLYNDVYFSSQSSPTTEAWTPFRRLPIELRVQIWLVCLRQNRMINVEIYSVEGDDDPDYVSYYTRQNQLGNVISGRRYTVKMTRQAHASSLNDLLQVNREARQVALKLHYRVHLCVSVGDDNNRVLYFNPEHDILNVRPGIPPPTIPYNPPRMVRPSIALIDFLHDVKAYDPKSRGAMHLALYCAYEEMFVDRYNLQGIDPHAPPRITPQLLHPVAAASFAEILRRGLQSVLLVVCFHSRMRGLGTGPLPVRGDSYHFAQTFPFHRHSNMSTSNLRWFETDPRPGVEYDLYHISVGLPECPERCLIGWKKLEAAFGIHDRVLATDPFRFYICPALNWFPQEEPSGRDKFDGGSFPVGLASHLNEEAETWARVRKDLDSLLSDPVTGYIHCTPRRGTRVDAEMFERMERAPSTAIGIWLIPAEAFKHPPKNWGHIFEVSGRPGLLLFQM